MIKKIITGLILTIVFCCLINITPLQALTVIELQDKIAESNKNKETLEREIAQYQSELNTINSQAQTLQGAIKTLDLTNNKLTAEIKLTQNNITETNLGINTTGGKINIQNNQINKDQLAIRNILRDISKNDETSPLEILLAHSQFSDFYSNLASLLILQEKLTDKVKELKDIKADLEQTKSSLEDKKKKLEIYNTDLANQKLILQTTIKEKNNLLNLTKNTQSNYQKILNEKKALMDAFDQELANYETALKLAIDPKSYPKSGKGILAWPVDNVIITQRFGYTNFAKTAYATGYHNGVDFAASIGTKVKSAGNGVVEGVGDTDTICPGASFGKWIFIRYENGLASTYGHLSLILVKAGQKIKTGEIVGYSGNTGYTTGPHLHMSVYASQGVKITTLKSTVCKGTYTMPIADTKAYLDPLLYL